MSHATSIAKGSFWIFISGFLTKLISFVYTVIIARLVVPDDVGAFYLALSIYSIVYIFADLGISYSLQRYVPFLYGKKEFAKLRSLIRMGLVWGTLLSLLFSVLAFTFSSQLASLVGQPTVAPVLQVMSVWILVKALDDLGKGILAGRKRMRESHGLAALQDFIKLVLTIIAFYVLGFNAGALSAGFLLSIIITLPLCFHYILEEMRSWPEEGVKIPFAQQFSLGKEVLIFGIIATFNGLLWAVIQSTDRIMLGYMLPDSLAQIAVYSMAVGVANVMLIFSASISSIFFPLASEYYGKGDFEGMNRMLKTAMKWLVMVTVPIVVTILALSGVLLNWFYGPTYAQGGTVLSIFVLGLFLYAIMSIPQLILSAMRRLDLELRATSVAAIANVALNALMIPVWGINGAALASFFAFFILSAMAYFYSRRIFGFSMPHEIYKPLLAGLLALVVMFLARDFITGGLGGYIQAQAGTGSPQFMDEFAQKAAKLLAFGISFLVSVALYFLALLLLRAFGPEELDTMEAALRKAKVPDAYILKARGILEAKWLGQWRF